MRKAARFRAAACLLAVLLAVLGAAPALAAPSTAEETPWAADIEAFAALHADTTAGMAVSVFQRDGTVYEGCFGFADVENRLPVDDGTVFEWGSVTKLLVWVSVMQLWEKGALALDADIRTYLPEGFLTNLRYDAPVTMLQLMEHTAGFQEMPFDLFLPADEEVPALGEALRLHEPEQVYEPGAVTAYSNWGAALAGYIVERISGEPFYAYVHEHIFDVLGMEHTALAPDLSDNAWVRERRGLLQCYTADAGLIPDCFYQISLYPAGMCTGTISDFAAFGRALLDESCPLFSSQAACQALFSPTSFYGDTDIPKNCHGFWVLPFGAAAVGHGGNTAGCSSYLVLSHDTGVGAVVMTNQSGEQIYNSDMMELIFGAYRPAEGREPPRGVYVSARTVLRGPAKLESVGITVFTEEDLEDFWVVSEENGTTLVSFPYGDMIKLPVWKVVLEFGLVLLWVLGVLFSAGYLTAWPIGAILRRIRHRERPPADPKRALRRIGAGLQLLLILAVGAAVLRITSYAASGSYIWLFALAGCLAAAMLPVLLMTALRKGGQRPGKGGRAPDILTCVFLAAAIANVAYWNLFMFWKI